MAQCLREIRVKAPGSLVIMGEHGVLHGQPALACSLDKGISLSLKLRADRLINIHSSLDIYHGSIDKLVSHPSFTFIITAIDHLKPPCGFDLEVTSNLDHTVGLGSSSAITIAITAALLALTLKDKPNREEILKQSHEIVLKVQGKASGLDLAASLYGGLISYRMQGYSVEQLPNLLPIHLVYSGYKTPTPKVLEKISRMEIEYSSTRMIHPGLYVLMGKLSQISAQAIRDGKLQELAKAMNMQQGLLETLGVSDETLSDIVWKLRKQSHIMAAKISGSGLGDCIVALGVIDSDIPPYRSIDCRMCSKGIQLVLIGS
ncbi:mevalonate kinase [Candidatus Liberibacter sp.]|uniref:mevalonate kinase family protein n=1 Tax=Candidatus Liberibacter sp. TaxID=34022 RepID=UPI0015F5305E|nr:GHMP kinase [Candidatus Liberibacter sp.]MBA5724370.1 GHMP kinase [Candidatus Liberibacter sp.]